MKYSCYSTLPKLKLNQKGVLTYVAKINLKVLKTEGRYHV